MHKFTVIYKDGTQFSGDPFNSEWNQVDDTKQIIKLIYMLGNKCLIMEGYKQYNHLLECVALGQTGIQKVLIMGRQENNTIIIIFDLKTNKIYQQTKLYGEEYGRQILAGWKAGLLNNPKAYFKELKNV